MSRNGDACAIGGSISEWSSLFELISPARSSDTWDRSRSLLPLRSFRAKLVTKLLDSNVYGRIAPRRRRSSPLMNPEVSASRNGLKYRMQAAMMPRPWMAWVHIATGHIVNNGSDPPMVDFRKTILQMIAARTLLFRKTRLHETFQDSQEATSKEEDHGDFPTQ